MPPLLGKGVASEGCRVDRCIPDHSRHADITPKFGRNVCLQGVGTVLCPDEPTRGTNQDIDRGMVIKLWHPTRLQLETKLSIAARADAAERATDASKARIQGSPTPACRLPLIHEGHKACSAEPDPVRLHGAARCRCSGRECRPKGRSSRVNDAALHH